MARARGQAVRRQGGPVRALADHEDQGTIGILTLGFGILVLMLVLVIASATAIHVAHLRASHLADELAISGADSLGGGGYYGRGDGLPTAVARDEAMAVIAGHLDRRATGSLEGARVSQLTIDDDSTVTVTVELTVYPLFGLEALVPFADGITLTATSDARAF